MYTYRHIYIVYGFGLWDPWEVWVCGKQPVHNEEGKDQANGEEDPIR